MTRKKPATSVFVPEQFGNYIRDRRRKCGYSSTKVFSDSIRQFTGVYIDPDTLNKIERGEREPDISKFVAICEALARPSNTTRYAIYEDALISSEPARFLANGSDDYSETQRQFINEYLQRFGRDPSPREMSDAFSPGGYVCERAIEQSIEDGSFSPDILIRTLIYRNRL